MTKNLGYTFFELLIVLCIISIISSFAFPSFASILDNQKTGAFSHELLAYLNSARIEAVTRNRVVTVCASLDETSCSNSREWSGQAIIIFDDLDGNGKIGENETILKKRTLNRETGSVIWRSFRNKSYLQWQPTGMTHYQNGNLTICPTSMNPRHAKTIIMNAAGRMYLGSDRDNDGVPEGSNGKNISC